MKVQWFSGPPPAVGWWPASTNQMLNCYRWWDGLAWSIYAARADSKAEASYCAAFKTTNQLLMRWRHWSIEIDGTDGRGF